MFRLSLARKHLATAAVFSVSTSTSSSSLLTSSSAVSSSWSMTSPSCATMAITPVSKSIMRFCSTTATTTTTEEQATEQQHEQQQASSSSSNTTTEAEQLDQLLEEVTILLDEPLPIGTLFKALSSESRSYVSSKRLSFETFLLRYPQKFQVFKQVGSRDRNIYVCKTGCAPAGANHAQEVAGTTVGAHAIHTGVTDGARARIYTVLKYIPNEWASYVALPIPDDVKKKIIRKPAKAFFERNPRYFEVRFNPNMGHTFEVRRSAQLQEFMKQKSQMEGRK